MTDISNCCGGFISVHCGGEGTSYYVCGACGKPCDPATPKDRIEQLEKENAELKSALKIAGAALRLVDEVWTRANLHPETNFLGDDEHEAWGNVKEALSNPVMKKVMAEIYNVYRLDDGGNEWILGAKETKNRIATAIRSSGEGK